MRALLYILMITCLCNCKLIFKEPPATIDDQRIVAEAQKRLDRYASRKKTNCRNRVIEDAIMHVDTIISQRFDRLTSVQDAFPLQPERPEKPEGLDIDSFFTPTPLVVDSNTYLLPSDKLK